MAGSDCRLKKTGAIEDPFLELVGLREAAPKTGPALKPTSGPQQSSDPFAGELRRMLLLPFQATRMPGTV